MDSTAISASEQEATQAESLIIVPDTEHDRYATFGFISWWDQEKLRRATVLVAGAGALGNEVIKNLALLGVGRLLIVDFDTIESANLSRSVLFREGDQGRKKAQVAAEAARQMNPDLQVRWIHGDLTQKLGLGVFRRVEAVIGCLDNREARLFINRACWKVGHPWVDGAMQEMLGEARVFWPGRGACYECTLGPADYQAMNLRYSCSALPRDLVMEGKIPTTPTVAAIIGGLQTQEALKLLHGMEVRPGTGLVFNGLTNDVYNITYPVKADCLSHQRYTPIEECPDLSAAKTTIGDMLDCVRQRMGKDAVLELDFELLEMFECVHGHPPTQVLQPVERVKESAAVCPICGSSRWPHQTHVIQGTESFLRKTLAEIGIPSLHVLIGRSGDTRRYFELTGDEGTVFHFS